MTIAEKLLRAKTDLDSAYEAGQKSEYDRRWDTLQQNGSRGNFGATFGAGWTDDIFDPKYDLVVTDGYMMFRGTNITDVKNISKRIDFSNCLNVQYLFAYSKIKYVGELDLRSINVPTTSFFIASTVVSIDKIILKEDGTTKWSSDSFDSVSTLEEITFEGTIGTDIKFTKCKKLGHESIENIFEHLSDTATGKTLTLSFDAVYAWWAHGTTEGALDSSWDDLCATKPNWTIILISRS